MNNWCISIKQVQQKIVSITYNDPQTYSSNYIITMGTIKSIKKTSVIAC
jgi:hypothetical protein